MTFSIIIPVYNVAPYLRECLASVFAAGKTLEKIGVENRCTADVEIICVDDGSTDGSGEILEEFRSRSGELGREKDSTTPHSSLKLPYFHVIHQKNAGVGAARNRGLDVATGDWILFLDADDLWSESTLANCLEAICPTPDADLVTFHVETFNDGDPWRPTNEKLEARTFDATDGLDCTTLEKGFWEVAYRRKIIGNVRFREGVKNGEDRVFFGQTLRNCHKIVHTNAICYGYRQRAGSATHASVTARYLNDIIWCWSERLIQILEDGRQMPASTVRLFVQWLTESIAWDYFSLPRHERVQVLSYWIERLKPVAAHAARLSWWYGFAIRLTNKLPFECVLWVFFYLPTWLKRKGLHR